MGHVLVRNLHVQVVRKLKLRAGSTVAPCKRNQGDSRARSPAEPGGRAG